MSCYAVLVDGGFIRRKLGTAAHPMTAAALNAFLTALGSHAALADHKLHRVYFYDASPLEATKEKPLAGGTINFATSHTAVQGKALHAELIKIPFLALRMGELGFRGWRLDKRSLRNHMASADLTITAGDLVPNIQQKGVVVVALRFEESFIAIKRTVNGVAIVAQRSNQARLQVGFIFHY